MLDHIHAIALGIRMIGKPYDIARLNPKHRRWQHKPYRILSNTRFAQPSIDDPTRFGSRHHQWHRRDSNTMRPIFWQHGLLCNHIIVTIGLNKGQPDPTRSFDMRTTLIFYRPVNFTRHNETITVQSDRMLTRPADKSQATITLHRIKAIA